MELPHGTIGRSEGVRWAVLARRSHPSSLNLLQGTLLCLVLCPFPRSSIAAYMIYLLPIPSSRHTFMKSTPRSMPMTFAEADGVKLARSQEHPAARSVATPRPRAMLEKVSRRQKRTNPLSLSLLVGPLSLQSLCCPRLLMPVLKCQPDVRL